MQNSENVSNIKTNKSADKRVIEQKDVKKGEGKKVFVKVVSGFICGAINGFFGGGGGMIVVPMLNKFCSYSEKVSHATAIAVILPVTVFSGSIMAAGFGFDIKILIPVAIGSVVGGVVGAFFIKKMPPKAVGYVFCLVMLFAGVRLTFF